jgi:hypothetical protein
MTKSNTPRVSTPRVSRKGNKSTEAAPAPIVAQEAAPAPQEAAPAPVPAPVKLTHYLALGRPVAGVGLVAHTAAFMELTGISTEKAVPGALVRKVLGSSAVAYHTAKGNFADTADGVKLTPLGSAHFALRTVSAEMKAGFVATLSTGKVDERTGIKAQDAAKPI